MQTIQRGSFKDALALVGSSPHLVRTIILAAFAQLVPIVGPIMVTGYFYLWARDAAWGLDTPLPDKTGSFSKLLRVGFIVFVIELLWGLVLGLISSFFSSIPLIGVGLGFLMSIVTLILSVYIMVLGMRAAIYEKFAPGVQLPQAFELVRRDPKGLARVLLVNLVASVVISVIAMGFLAGVFLMLDGGTSAVLMFDVVTLCTVFFLLLLALGVVVNAVVMRMLGCWMSQFVPSAWGDSQSGLPDGVGPARVF